MDINKLPKIMPEEAKKTVKKNRGIYFWINKQDNKVVYIGIALGKEGLRRRIVSQHLNPNYLEFRSSVHSERDAFQLSNAVEKNGKDGSTKYGIDKSSFRKALGRMEKLKPGSDTVNFIMNNFYLKIFESDDPNYINELEKYSISKYKPIYNSAHKSKTNLTLPTRVSPYE